MVGVILIGAMLLLAVFSYTAVKRGNRIIFGVLALSTDVVLSIITLPALLANVPHEGMSLVYNLGIPATVLYVAIAAVCAVSVTYNAVKLREESKPPAQSGAEPSTAN